MTKFLDGKKPFYFFILLMLFNLGNIILNQFRIFGFSRYSQNDPLPLWNFSNVFVIYSGLMILISVLCLIGINFRRDYFRKVSLGLVGIGVTYLLFFQYSSLSSTYRPVLNFSHYMYTISYLLLTIILLLRIDWFKEKFSLSSVNKNIGDYNFVILLYFSLISFLHLATLNSTLLPITYLVTAAIVSSFAFFTMHNSLSKRLSSVKTLLKIASITLIILNFVLSVPVLVLMLFGVGVNSNPRESADAGYSLVLLISLFSPLVLFPLIGFFLKRKTREKNYPSFYFWLLLSNLVYLVLIVFLLMWVLPNYPGH